MKLIKLNIPKLLQGLTALIFFLDFAVERIIVIHAPQIISTKSGEIYRYHLGGTEYHFLKLWQKILAESLEAGLLLMICVTLPVSLIDMIKKGKIDFLK